MSPCDLFGRFTYRGEVFTVNFANPSPANVLGSVCAEDGYPVCAKKASFFANLQDHTVGWFPIRDDNRTCKDQRGYSTHGRYVSVYHIRTCGVEGLRANLFKRFL